MANLYLPEWSTGDLVTAVKLHQLIESIRYMRERQPHIIAMWGSPDIVGNIAFSGLYSVNVNGPEFINNGDNGYFTLEFPPGLASLRTLQITPAPSEANGALLATVHDESESSVVVEVKDAGGSDLEDFNLWITASGQQTAKLPGGLESVFSPPHISPLSPYFFNAIGNSITYQHATVPYFFDINGGTEWEGSYGIGEIVGYIFVDPNSYEGYSGAGQAWGEYPVSLPSGILNFLFGLEVQAASGSNGALQVTAKNASISGFTAFVYDSGGTPIQPHALWIRARGTLASGVLPITPQNRSWGLSEVTASTQITSTLLQSYTNCCHYRLRRTPFVFNLYGDMIYDGAGVGCLEGYIFVDPPTYKESTGEEYYGAGTRYGQYRLRFPDGVFEQLLFVRVQFASSSNAWSVASISQEGPGGVMVFVWDVGGSEMGSHALWISAVGILKPGVLP